ncbi:phospholipid scramblase-related protein [Verrucomicrobiota bacterium]
MDVLSRNQFRIKERAEILKAAFNFDVSDPDTGQVIMEAREENLGRITKIFRFSSYKRTTPFDIALKTVDGQPVLRMKRGIPRFVSCVEVYDDHGELIGSFKQKPFSISGAFDVLDASGRFVCLLKGGLTGWNFRFLASDDIELARVTKKWAGLGKELCTSADDYMLEIDEAVPEGGIIRRLIIASALCIGLVVKIEMP